MIEKKKKVKLIVVPAAELKPADMWVICEMEICPSCGTNDKSGNWRHLMCYRCLRALPPGVMKSVDGQPAAIMLEAFLKFMKALPRRYAFLIQRGVEREAEAAMNKAPAPEPAAAVATPAPRPVAPKPTPAPSTPGDAARRRDNRAWDEDNWETIWREGGLSPYQSIKCQAILSNDTSAAGADVSRRIILYHSGKETRADAISGIRAPRYKGRQPTPRRQLAKR
jgi:hypothetical protein